MSAAATSLCGVIGGVAETVVGVLPTSVVRKRLLILEVSPYTQQIIVRTIIIAAGFDHFFREQSR